MNDFRDLARSLLDDEQGASAPAVAAPQYDTSDAPADTSPPDTDVSALIRAKADQYGIPENIALALADTESGLRPDAQGPIIGSGMHRGDRAYGLYQLTGATAKDLGVDRYDVGQNIDGGLRYLKSNYDRFGNWDMAIAAHQAGPGAVAKAGGIPEATDGLSTTQQYVQRVLDKAARLGATVSRQKEQPQFDDSTGTTTLDRIGDMLGKHITNQRNDGDWYTNTPKRFSASMAKLFSDSASMIYGLTSDENGGVLRRNEGTLGRIKAWADDQSAKLEKELAADPDVARAMARNAEAHGMWETMKAIKDEPDILADVVTRSMAPFVAAIPLTLAGEAVGGAIGLTAAAGRVASMFGASAETAATVGRMVGANIGASAGEGATTAAGDYTEIQDKMIAAGMTPEEARDAAVSGATKIGAVTAAMSLFGTGHSVAKIVTEGLEKSGLKAAVKSAALETGRSALEEGTQEVAEDLIKDKTLNDQGVASSSDLGKSFVLGAAAGGAVGGAAGLKEVAAAAIPSGVDAAQPGGLQADAAPAQEPPAQDAVPSQLITPVNNGIMPEVMARLSQAQSVEEAASIIDSSLSDVKAKVTGGVSLDSMSKLQAIRQVADTQSMRQMLDQLAPADRQSALESVSAALSGDPRMPNAARVQAIEKLHGMLSDTGTLQAAQNELNAAGLQGTLEEKTAIEGANRLVSSPEFAQHTANQKDDIRNALARTIDTLNNPAIPESDRAAAADRLNRYAAESGIVQEQPAQKPTVEQKLADAATELDQNRSALQAITSSPEWSAHVSALKGDERSAVLQKLDSVSNPNLPASYRNNLSIELLNEADAAGIGIPTMTEPAQQDGTVQTAQSAPAASGAQTGVQTSPITADDARGALASLKLSPEHGTLTMADPRKLPLFGLTSSDGRITAGRARMVQVLGRAFGREVVFYDQNNASKVIDGFVTPGNSKMIFLNTRSSGAASPEALFGHELLHTMPKDLRDQFIGAMQKVLPPDAAGKLAGYINQPDLNDGARMEEISADLFGNGFNNPEMIGKALESMPVSAAQKVITHIRALVAKIRAALGGAKDFETQKFITDLNAYEAAWVSAFREFVARENAGKGSIGGRPASELSIQDLAALAATKDSPLKDKAEAEIARREQNPGTMDQIEAEAAKAGEPAAEKTKEQQTAIQKEVDRIRKKKKKGELLTDREKIAADHAAEQEASKKKAEEAKKAKAADEALSEEEQAALQDELASETGAQFTDADVNEEMPIRYSKRRNDFTDPEQRKEVSTAHPTAAGHENDSYENKIVIDTKDIADSKKALAAVKEAISGYNTMSGKGDPLVELHDTVVSNLLRLYDKVPQNVRDRAKLWYDGANAIASDWTKIYGVSERQAAGVLAALSPQMDWFKNVSLAERVMHIWKNRQDQVWTPAMTKWAETWAAKNGESEKSRKETLDAARRLEGTPLYEMNNEDAAKFIRAFDETYHPRSYRMVTPEGGYADFAENDGGSESSVTWGGFPVIEKAVSILRDGSFRNINNSLGDNHKVRNFYNNIIAPNSEDGHVTIDTHAIAAALMKPVSGDAKEVKDNFGGIAGSSATGSRGTYALFADAYRDAAAKRGILPREMQSITWEAIRAMFPPAVKRAVSPKVSAIWDQFRAGEITREQALKKVDALAGKADGVTWINQGAGVRPADGGVSFSAPKSIDPENGRSLPVTASISLSAATDSIPGLDQLTKLANKGNASAHALLQDIAMDSLKHLLSGINAKVNFDRSTGLFEGSVEPSLAMSVTFDDSNRKAVLAALAKFATNFNQKQIHVRTNTKDDAGKAYNDGSYATPVFQWELKQALTRKQVQQIIDESGLYGLTFGEDFVEAYYVGDPKDGQATGEFFANIRKADELLARRDAKVHQGTQRLWPYGSGEQLIPYERIAGDLPQPAEAPSVETAKRIAAFLNDGKRVASYEQAPITPEQHALQSEIARIFESLPVNDLKNPIVRKAYNELKKETIRQYNLLPVKVELYKNAEPYKNSAAMRRDIVDNNHLFVYATSPDTFGPQGHDFSKHPLLSETGINDSNGRPMLVNDLFRAIHDYFAHGMSPTQFGPKGEEAAWKNHMSTIQNPWARWALTTETRGQNSWVNFRDGMDQSTPLLDRGFAEQKAALMPVEYALTGDKKTDKPMVDFIKTLPASQHNGSLKEGFKFSTERKSLEEFSKELKDKAKASVEYGSMLSKMHEWSFNVGDMLLSTKTGKVYEITGRTFNRVGPLSKNDWQPVYSYVSGREGEEGYERGTMREKAILESTTLKSLMTPTKFSSSRGSIQTVWDSPEPSKMDDFIHTMQDKHVDMRRAIDSIKKTGKKIADVWNPYLQEELYHGRTAKQTKDFLDHEMKPLLQSMQAAGVGIEDLNKFLHMRHAEERNNQIASINPAMPDGGSGVKTADAKKYLASLSPQQMRVMNALAKRVDAITKKTRDLLVSSGLETQDTINQWDRTYKNYVPLMREDGSMGVGQGFSVRGSASKRAMGSDKAVSDILANIAMMRERTITRAEKNRVALAAMGLAIQNPNPDYWLPVIPGQDVVKQERALIDMGINPLDAKNLMNQPTKRYIDPNTGMVRTMADNTIGSMPNVITTRFQGRDYYLVMNPDNERAVRMAASMKNLDADKLGRVMSEARKITRWVAAVNTQYNPVFGILNLIRDTGSSMLNLTSTPLAGHQAEVAANIGSAIRGIYISLRDARNGVQTKSQWAQLWEEFQNAGGRTGYRDMFASSDDRSKALQAELDSLTAGRAKKLGHAVMGFLDDFNDTLENSVRLSAYKAAKDSGMTNAQAASLAKNLTVNFNRKGTIATQAGALYAFFNASAQGTARLYQTMNGPAGKKIAIGGALLGAMQAMMLAAAGISDDVPEFVKQRNFIIPIGGKKYLAVPMPLGFNVLPSVSRMAVELAFRGGKDAMRTTADAIDLLADNFNPIGNAGLSVQTISPTFADPLVALSENKDWAGRPIAKKDFSSLKPTPGHTRVFGGASDLGKGLSKAINWLTGGTEYTPGMLSPTPDQIDFLVGQIFGGVGREALKANEAISSLVTGEDLAANKIPLAGRFYGSANGEAAERGKFYENIVRLNELEAQMSGLKGEGKPVADFIAENPQVRLAKEAGKIEKEISSLRKMRTKLVAAGAPKERIRQIDQRITAQMARLNDRMESMQ